MNKFIQNLKLKKFDAVIVVILVAIAGLVLARTDYLAPSIEDVIHPSIGPDEEDPEVVIPEPLLPPESIIPGYLRAVSPEDEGLHYDKISVCREWWYFTAVFNEDSDFAEWTVSISFNHMARSDLAGTAKPDLLVITLHGPNGEEYGGMINKERGFGILKQPTLDARTPGVGVSFEDSWAEGDAPEWFVHAEDNEIDNNHEIIIDLRFFAPYGPVWTYGNRAFDKTISNLASYMYTGCNVTGTIQLDGEEFDVIGVGHHEHAWSPNVVTKGLINGWDWSHITLDNGWNIYYNTFYQTPQYISTKTPNLNPWSSAILTTNNGQTITTFGDVNPELTESDDEIFTFVKMPIDIHVNAQPGVIQPLLNSYDMSLNIDISLENTYENIWKLPTYVGMNVGRCTVKGTITWTDDEGEHIVEIQGIGSVWSMRALL
jgi:hypothetical protein